MNESELTTLRKQAVNGEHILCSDVVKLIDQCLAKELRNSKEVCEAIVRIVEVSGSECFEKNFRLPDETVRCTVWCVIGDNAQSFYEAAHRWLEDEGLKED